MDILECKAYHEGILQMNCDRIAKYQRTKLISQIFGIVIFIVALLSLFKIISVEMDNLAKLGGLFGGIFFCAKDLFSKPDIDGMKRENLSKEILLKQYGNLEGLSNEEKEQLRSNCSKLLDNLSTSK